MDAHEASAMQRQLAAIEQKLATAPKPKYQGRLRCINYTTRAVQSVRINIPAAKLLLLL